jgi:RecA-family ATPase
MTKSLHRDVIEKALNEAFVKLPPKEKKAEHHIGIKPTIPESLENISHLKLMLDRMDPDPHEHGNRVDWRNQVWGIASLGWVSGRDIALEYSERGDLFDEIDFDGVWNSYDPTRGITYRSLFYFADKAGYQGQKDFPDNGQPKPVQEASGLVTISADQVKAEPIEWLVEGIFPLGMLGVIGGNPGMGKSQIAINLAALATSGKGSPDKKTFHDVGSVIILANEDDPARTIRPRLEAAGAVLSKVHIVQGVTNPKKEIDYFQLDKDVATLTQKAKELGDVRLIIIDPPNAYIGGKTDTYKDSDVRKLLAPLQVLANDTGALILLVVHLNKRNDGGAHQRFNGTTAWIAVARVAYLVGEDEASRTRFMLPVKNNIGNDKKGYGYEILEKIYPNPTGDIKTSRIFWLDATERPVSELLEVKKKAKPSAIDEAKEFLEEELAKAPKPVKEIQKLAKDAGISKASLQRAKEELEIRSQKNGDSWNWSLSPLAVKPNHLKGENHA